MISLIHWSDDHNVPTIHLDPDYVVAVIESVEDGQPVADVHLTGGAKFTVKDRERNVCRQIKEYKETF